MGLIGKIKTRIAAHEAVEYFKDFVKGLNVSSQTKAYLLAVISPLITTALTGGVLVYSGVDHKVAIWGSIVNLFFQLWHRFQQTPVPREVWTDAQRIANEKVLELEAAHNKAMAEKAQADADAAAKKAVADAVAKKVGVGFPPDTNRE